MAHKSGIIPVLYVILSGGFIDFIIGQHERLIELSRIFFLFFLWIFVNNLEAVR